MDSEFKIFDSEDFYMIYDVSEYEDDEDNTHTESEWDQDMYDESMERISEEYDEWRGDCIIKYVARTSGWRGESSGIQYLDSPDLKDLISLGCDADILRIYKEDHEYTIELSHHDGKNFYTASKIDLNLSKKVLVEEANSAADCNCGYDLSEVLQRMSDNLYVSNATKQDLLEAIKESI